MIDTDIMHRFPPRMSAFPDEEIDELASDEEELSAHSALAKDLDQLVPSFKLGLWSLDQFVPSLEEAGGSHRDSLQDSRLESTSIFPLSIAPPHKISSTKSLPSLHLSRRRSHSQPPSPNSPSTVLQSGHSDVPLDFEHSRLSWIGSLFDLI